MGYTTEFTGSLMFSRPLKPTEVEYINAFSDCRHMRLDVAKLKETYKGQYGNPFATKEEDVYGNEGEYFIHELEYGSKTIIDYNRPPKSQPGLWCKWIVTSDELHWDGNEKFYSYVEWLQYLIDRFFDPWNVKLNGAIQWEGERRDDLGVISVRNSKITTIFEGPSDSDSDSEDGYSSESA